MRRRVVAMMLTGCAGLPLGLFAGVRAAQNGDARATVLDGVFSADQARRGQAAYNEHCASCHLDDLSGTDRGPALAGDSFLNNRVGFTVGDLFERTYTSMPQDRPGTMSREMTRDIVAYLLRANDYPAGDMELSVDTASLRAVRVNRKD